MAAGIDGDVILVGPDGSESFHPGMGSGGPIRSVTWES